MAVRLPRRAVALLVGLWIVSLVAVAVVAAQSRQWGPLERLPEPIVLSGDDIGFRVEGTITGVPAGRLVIRSRSGEWVEPRNAPGSSVIPLNAD